MQQMHPTQKAIEGFTLVEMAIVLVIIGLLVGGILVGTDLIKTAYRRAEVSQMGKFASAYNTFRLKYNCVPGDCASASALGLGMDGNGDGMIDYLVPGANIQEYYQAWAQLGAANLVAGQYSGVNPFDGSCLPGVCPPSVISAQGAYWIGGIASLGNSMFLSAPYGTNMYADTYATLFIVANSSRWHGVLGVYDTFYMDTKLDDGVADKGRLLTVNSNEAAGNCVTGDPTVTNGSVNYNMSDTANDCLPLYVFQ
jgi:prepilin-type N-terminal cleavage/methylation domain-containing protein